MEKMLCIVCAGGSGERWVSTGGDGRSFALEQAVCATPSPPVPIALGAGWMWQHGVHVAAVQAAEQGIGWNRRRVWSVPWDSPSCHGRRAFQLVCFCIQSFGLGFH